MSGSGDGETYQPKPDDGAIPIKIALIGDSGVGKTSLLQRFSQGQFKDNQASTIGFDHAQKIMRLNGVDVRLIIWDTAGQERFARAYFTSNITFRGLLGVVIVYDVTNAQSYERLKCFWLEELANHVSEVEPLKMVVGNKIDMGGLRQVSTEQGQRFSKTCDALFVEASAKSGEAVHDVFEQLAVKILESGLVDVEGKKGSHHHSVILNEKAPAPKASTCSNC